MSSRPSLLARFARHRAGLVGLIVVGVLFGLGSIAPWVAPYDPLAANVRIQLQGPSAVHWLGTDELGRDILSRLLYGAALSLRVGLLAVAVGMGVGVPLGALSGYYAGAFDLIGQRLVDTLQAFPGILLALLVAAVAGPRLEWTIGVLGVLSIPVYTRLCRGSVLQTKQLSYVEAARAVGCGEARVIVRHVLPNSLAPVIIQSSIQFALSVLLLAGLGFLGLGAQPPTPEWGSMLAQGRVYMRTSPHMVIFPALVISIAVLALNLVGDALRDALDPRGADA
ncbi:MAG: ABC transporter permease [Chloroflexota bacterium]|nr:ABC transporter permease [Chloroflexota bacterium]